MNEVVDAVNARLKSPYFGYAVLAFIALNWRGIFMLLAIQDTPQARLWAFDQETSFLTLVMYPLLIAAAISILSHWIRLAFGYMAISPLARLERIHLQAEHEKALLRSQYDKQRAEFFAAEEQDLIDKAKRDLEVEGIQDQETKKKLSDEINKLREDRAKLNDDVASFKAETLSPAAAMLMKAANKTGDGKIEIADSMDTRYVRTGLKLFGSENDRDFKKFQSAVNELRQLGFLEDIAITESAALFEFNERGWMAIEKLP